MHDRKAIFTIRFLPIIFCGVFVWGSLLFFPRAHAMEIDDSRLSAGITLDPAYPKPESTVTATLETYSIDLASSIITWEVNGKVVRQSYGGRTYTLSTGPIGSVMTLRATARDPQGKVMEFSKTVEVADVSLLWEARTYTPPFYHGRALFTPGSEVAVMALPTILSSKGVPIDPQKLSYRWFSNDGYTLLAEGYGLQSIVLKSKEAFTDFVLIVNILDDTGTTRTIGRTTIPITAPILLFYEVDPLLGIRYGRTLFDSFTIDTTEATIIAEPFYMSADTRTSSSLTYAWDIAGTELSTPGKVVLRPEGQGAGTADLSLTVAHQAVWQQRAGGEMTVHFKSTTAGSGTDF